MDKEKGAMNFFPVVVILFSKLCSRLILGVIRGDLKRRHIAHTNTHAQTHTHTNIQFEVNYIEIISELKLFN